MILIITLLYLVIDYKFNIIPNDYILIYILFLGIYKGLISTDIKELFNLESTKQLFIKYGVKSTLSTFFSVVLIVVYYYGRNLFSLNVFEILLTILLIIILFRFILWGVEKDGIIN
ncbi:hypothetical protein HMPREF9709_01085 [Helcococcus kunzii ATCC 51366]|uniref:Uncharacterized protein n=1 Tax=Helcococcus kunzii ATCC 51366 TaxID=883114 RepID=H3NP24_9FIRM|nr:hypothetical protein [Helcococcus kunzii]EHR34149.1 hypothetical protein HMPREF9709_01085 [Helcococcus kunzii ATCC 51366]